MKITVTLTASQIEFLLREVDSSISQDANDGVGVRLRMEREGTITQKFLDAGYEGWTP